MNREQLMNVLLAPHVTEKTSTAMQNHNQYCFRVQRRATKPDIKAAVELMFEVKVRAVQVVNEPGKARKFGKLRGPHPGLEESVCQPGRRPDDRLRSQGKGLRSHGTHQVQAHVPRHPHRRARRPLAPAQGRAVRSR